MSKPRRAPPMLRLMELDLSMGSSIGSVFNNEDDIVSTQ